MSLLLCSGQMLCGDNTPARTAAIEPSLARFSRRRRINHRPIDSHYYQLALFTALFVTAAVTANIFSAHLVHVTGQT